MADIINREDTRRALGVIREYKRVPRFFRDLFFPGTLQSPETKIDMEKVSKGRKIAPYVSPMREGKPVYELGSTVLTVQPPYLKPLDVMRPEQMLKRMPGHLIGQQMSPEQNRNMMFAEIVEDHIEAIQARIEVMASEAILTGKVVATESDDHPAFEIDYGRDGGQTITLGSGYWSSSSDIISAIEAYVKIMARAKLGGLPSLLIVGTDVWDVMRVNEGIKDQLDTRYRGTNADLITGLGDGTEAQYKGRLGNLDVWVYSGYYENDAGSEVEIMNAKDVLLANREVDGVIGYGAIQEIDNLVALPMYTKTFDQQNPSARFVLTQSAPLPIVGRPNRTLKARVLA